MPRRDINEKIWNGKDSVLPEIRNAAKECLLTNPPRSHSMMLSAYISFFNKQSMLTKCWWFVLMWNHAFFLYLYKDKLNHSEINVLISFLLKFKKIVSHKKLVDLSLRAVSISQTDSDVPAHEEALALITHAQVLVLDPRNKSAVVEAIKQAIQLEHHIRQEDNKLQALRQLVRILRKVSEVYGALGERDMQLSFLKDAMDLALGEADTVDQAEKIQAIFNRLDRREEGQ